MDIKHLQPIIDLMNLQEERLVKKIDEVISTVKEQNGRIGDTEDYIVKLEKAVNEGDLRCMYIQQGKAKELERKEKKETRNKWVVRTLLVVMGLLSGYYYKTKEGIIEVAEDAGKVSIELIYRKDDSTFVVPQVYLRNTGDQKYFEANEIYFEIDKK